MMDKRAGESGKFQSRVGGWGGGGREGAGRRSARVITGGELLGAGGIVVVTM